MEVRGYLSILLPNSNKQLKTITKLQEHNLQGMNISDKKLARRYLLRLETQYGKRSKRTAYILLKLRHRRRIKDKVSAFSDFNGT